VTRTESILAQARESDLRTAREYAKVLFQHGLIQAREDWKPATKSTRLRGLQGE
jgi:hypothetical protein